MMHQEEEEKKRWLVKQKKNDSMYESPKSSGVGKLKVRIETQDQQNEQLDA